MNGVPPSLDEEGALRCPHCGQTSGIENRPPDSSGPSVYVHPDTDDYDSPAGTRGNYVRIDRWCSMCGTTFGLFIGNHKGTEYLCVLQREWTTPAEHTEENQ
ncbi:hypothetical protein ACWEQ3_30245 [Streptomyces mirabilis]